MTTALAPAAVDVDGVHATLVGDGLPVTLFAHGIGGSVAETRPLAARVPGTRVLAEFRGHGRSAPLPGGWDYDVLADDLQAVADATGATGAVGVSLGSGALLRLLTRDPARFARLALVLPASLDAARSDGATLRLARLGTAIDAGDVDAVTALLLDELPAAARSTRAAAVLLRRRATQLVQRPAPRPLRDDRPLHDRALLAAVTAPTLVVAQRGDPLHRLDVAHDLAGALPAGQLLVTPPGGVFFTAAREVQEALAVHLAPETMRTP